MAREGLRFELTSAFQKALRQNETIILKGLKVGEPAPAQTRRYHRPGRSKGRRRCAAWS